jgi:hypothetical protein
MAAAGILQQLQSRTALQDCVSETVIEFITIFPFFSDTNLQQFLSNIFFSAVNFLSVSHYLCHSCG